MRALFPYLLALLTMLPAGASAYRLDIKPVLARTEGAPSRRWVEKGLRQAIRVLRTGTGVRFVLHSTTIVNRSLPLNLSNRVETGKEFTVLSENKLIKLPRGINVIVTGPLIDGGVRYVAGITLNGCNTSGLRIAVANAMEFQTNGESRYPHFIVTVVHEVLHTLCLEHDNSKPNIMHSDALSLVGKQRLPFPWYTKDIVNWYLGLFNWR